MEQFFWHVWVFLNIGHLLSLICDPFWKLIFELLYKMAVLSWYKTKQKNILQHVTVFHLHYSSLYTDGLIITPVCVSMCVWYVYIVYYIYLKLSFICKFRYTADFIQSGPVVLGRIQCKQTDNPIFHFYNIIIDMDGFICLYLWSKAPS